MAMELGWAGEEWVGQGGPCLGAGISGAVVASYHTWVDYLLISIWRGVPSCSTRS